MAEVLLKGFLQFMYGALLMGGGAAASNFSKHAKKWQQQCKVLTAKQAIVPSFGLVLLFCDIPAIEKTLDGKEEI